MTPARHDITTVVGDALSFTLTFYEYGTRTPVDLSAGVVSAMLIFTDDCSPHLAFRSSGSTLEDGIVGLSLHRAQTIALPTGLHRWWLKYTVGASVQTLVSGTVRITKPEPSL